MLVIDTNLWVSYLLFAPSPLGNKLTHILECNSYAMSDATFAELAEVLMRPKFEKFLPEGIRQGLMRKTALGAEWFTPVQTITNCRDSKDNKFLELAIAAQATHILTGDEDLLCLDPFQGICIQTVSKFKVGR